MRVVTYRFPRHVGFDSSCLIAPKLKGEIAEALSRGYGPRIARFALAILGGAVPLAGGALGGAAGALSTGHVCPVPTRVRNRRYVRMTKLLAAKAFACLLPGSRGSLAIEDHQKRS
jgi:hypothetical protein